MANLIYLEKNWKKNDIANKDNETLSVSPCKYQAVGEIWY